MKRTLTTTSLGKDTSSAKTSRCELLFLSHLFICDSCSSLFVCCLTNFHYFVWQNDGLHFRQPWVTGVTEEVERLKLRVHEHEKLLRECEALKVRFNCQFHNKVSCLYYISKPLFGLPVLCTGTGCNAGKAGDRT